MARSPIPAVSQQSSSNLNQQLVLFTLPYSHRCLPRLRACIHSAVIQTHTHSVWTVSHSVPCTLGDVQVCVCVCVCVYKCMCARVYVYVHVCGVGVMTLCIRGLTCLTWHGVAVDRD